jgi:hypothetical protein
LLLPTLIAIPLLLIWILTLVDILRRPDLGGGAKVLWALAALVFPIVGVLVYLFVRPSQPGERATTLEPVGDESFEVRQRHGPA